MTIPQIPTTRFTPKIGNASCVALGCDHYGLEISNETSFDQLDMYAQAGGNLLDTARIYGQLVDEGPSTSEQVIGQWLRKNGMRSSMHIISKGGHPKRTDMSASRLDWRSLSRDLEGSLNQLQVDSLDLWLLHRDDTQIGVDEIVDMISEFQSMGRTAEVGVSNWSVKRIAQAQEYARKTGRAPLVASEIQWSLAACTPTQWGDETIICCNPTERSWYEEHHMPILCYSPQAKGFFSKVLSGAADTLSQRAVQRFMTNENLQRATRVEHLCRELDVKPSAIALAYLTSQANTTIPIIGSSKIDQLADTLQGTGLRLGPEQLEYLVGTP